MRLLWDWILAIIGLLFVPVGASMLPHLWHQRQPHILQAETPRAWPWPLGNGMWQGFRRSIAAGMVLFPIVTAFHSVTLLFADPGLISTVLAADGPESVPAWLEVPPGVAMGILLLLWFTMSLVNRPKFLVPPKLREDPGMIQAYFRRRRAKKRPWTVEPSQDWADWPSTGGPDAA